ncbi:MAG: malonyl-CoA decarboxylase [Rhizobiales bacterium]|nr:malonyl-CoA decarboxylase [Hyphomicrobiales bacterium]
MSFLADLLSTIFDRQSGFEAKTPWEPKPIADLCSDLISSKGEVKGMSLSSQILHSYSKMANDEKLAFFNILVKDMDICSEDVKKSLEAYKKNPSKMTYRAFMEASEPKRQEFLRRLNQVSGATAELVSMRKDLLKITHKNPVLSSLDLDFRHLFASWFNRGFLVLRPINWQSPAHILEKIIKYEAVHSIDSWDDLRLRLQPDDRRCFAFFHPSMPDDPLIFVEVALTDHVSCSIQQVLSEDRKTVEPENINTAVFYSISNCQSGLAGISFGNSLIKQVVTDLSKEFSNLNRFVTLSPIPNFNKWIDNQAEENILQSENLQQSVAYYLSKAKTKRGAPYDPVARFHLGNGALIHAVHLDADMSKKGVEQSNGVMVNYLYDLQAIESNHEKFTSNNEVATSKQVENLAQMYNETGNA